MIPTILLAAAGGCAYITPIDATLSYQGPLYDGSPAGVEEALPESLERRAGPYVVRLSLEPEVPKVSGQVRIAYVIEDRSSTPPSPVRGARIACKAGMPNVPGHIHNLGVHGEHPEVAPGRYEMAPLTFGMGGRWDLVFQVVLADGRQFYGVFPIRIQGPPWPGPVRYDPPRKR